MLARAVLLYKCDSLPFVFPLPLCHTLQPASQLSQVVLPQEVVANYKISARATRKFELVVVVNQLVWAFKFAHSFIHLVDNLAQAASSSSLAPPDRFSFRLRSEKNWLVLLSSSHNNFSAVIHLRCPVDLSTN